MKLSQLNLKWCTPLCLFGHIFLLYNRQFVFIDFRHYIDYRYTLTTPPGKVTGKGRRMSAMYGIASNDVSVVRCC